MQRLFVLEKNPIIFDREAVSVLASDLTESLGDLTCTPAGIYARYDALMADHSNWITKTDLGLCSDNTNHVYRYDFAAPTPHYNGEGSETKPKAILISGIHFEWAGIYGLFFALKELMTNPAHYQFMSNVHLIVIPCANPWTTIDTNYSASGSGHLNANGVEIHRNFEVDWASSTSGTANYGGAAALSEVETQYIDNILKANTDAAFLLSCHNYSTATNDFIWVSAATKYMCNMGFRLIDKLSHSWNSRFTLPGLNSYRPSGIESWDDRLGKSGLSTTGGTEAKQATKYGIQGVNVEVDGAFYPHGTTQNPEAQMSAFTLSRACEVYVNFLRMAFAAFDEKDKKRYWK